MARRLDWEKDRRRSLTTPSPLGSFRTEPISNFVDEPRPTAPKSCPTEHPPFPAHLQAQVAKIAEALRTGRPPKFRKNTPSAFRDMLVEHAKQRLLKLGFKLREVPNSHS